MSCLRVAVVIATTLLGCCICCRNVNPIGQFGACRPLCEYVRNYRFEDCSGVWNLFFKPKHPDNCAHQCQATYEQVAKWNEMYILYYTKNTEVNEPIKWQFKNCQPCGCVSNVDGCFTGAVTYGCEAVNIFFFVLFVNENYRITYSCADSSLAGDEDFVQVLIWMRPHQPSEALLYEALCKMQDLYRINFGCEPPEMELVVQDPIICEQVIAVEVELCGSH